ncbi:His-Xaa-Ser system radical SAM maturase HxsC [Flavobacterium sharifuzzamanii]|uniref:His-Xaa-Ser system radical SAM maturase HxsC n=1 Tax=Flavobacterium sharifuzzamanii TaxID=2211133 RepID=UPI000DAB3FE7|nr:His-Xaa-Ser system radical SAM maturase HxsC [Flavobacterium sharifuzzamanii]KAF2082093.1 His-Xaa-Ser system radical SAM maturase HxsC [Flavobacterium sharifuzzamanii]
MILKTKGSPYDINTPIIGRVTRIPENIEYEIFISETIFSKTWYKFKAVLSTVKIISSLEIPIIHSIEKLDHLDEGDIVIINTDGIINTIYRKNSDHNFLLFTERCNSNCLMCSQPPKDRDDTDYFFSQYSQAIPLIPKDCPEIGITGGEPTLLGNRFLKLIKQLKEELPETELHCLTNGRSFAWENVAQKVGEIDHKRLMLAVPLYADVYHIHDYIVQAKDAFNQTIQGIYNLAKYGQRIEIRIVLHKQTIPRLAKLAKFIYKNLPFVEHIAFMGLEHEGYTSFNIDKLWIDPVEYQQELTEAVSYLSDFGMNVSIYNAQLCTLPENLWKYSRKSISDWKNIYFDECNKCDLLDQCGGMFASGIKKHSDFIKAIYFS